MALFCMSADGRSQSDVNHPAAGGPDGAEARLPQQEHPLEYASNHMFVELAEGRFLVDTGSPMTFARGGTVTFAGESRVIAKSMLGLDLDAICGALGFQCDGLLGTDLLGQCTTCWDGPGKRFIVRPGEPPEHAVVVPYRDLLGTPVVDAYIGSRTAACIFDTGAQYGYILSESLAAGAQADGAIEDFNPVIGPIRSAAWRMPVEMGGIRFDERFGLLDGLSAGLLGATGVEAIIGCSWLPGRKVWFMPRRSRIAFA